MIAVEWYFFVNKMGYFNDDTVGGCFMFALFSKKKKHLLINLITPFSAPCRPN